MPSTIDKHFKTIVIYLIIFQNKLIYLFGKLSEKLLINQLLEMVKKYLLFIFLLYSKFVSTYTETIPVSDSYSTVDMIYMNSIFIYRQMLTKSIKL